MKFKLKKYVEHFHGFSLSVKIVITILTIITLWMASGIFSFGSKAAPNSNKTQIANVKVIESAATLKSKYLDLNAITEASQVVKIKAEVEGTISELIAKEGQMLRKGEIILKIDVDNRKKDIEQAEAELNRRRLNYDSTKALFKKNLSSEIALAEATALYKTAMSDLSKAKLDLEKTVVRAPFDGYVDLIHVDVGDFVSPNFQDSTLAVFLSKTPMLAIANIPEKDISQVKNTSTAEIHYGSNIKLGDLKFLSKVSDPATRTFRIEFNVDNDDLSLLSGETIQVKIPLEPTFAHQIPKSALVLDIKGDLGVKTVTTDETVKVYPIDIIEEDGNSIWVTGLPQEASIIVLGQSYTKDGDKVKVDRQLS